jgi:hypothetical protein
VKIFWGGGELGRGETWGIRVRGGGGMREEGGSIGLRSQGALGVLVVVRKKRARVLLAGHILCSIVRGISRYLALARNHNGKLLPRGHPRGESYGHHRTLGEGKDSKEREHRFVSVSNGHGEEEKELRGGKVCGGPMCLRLRVRSGIERRRACGVCVANGETEGEWLRRNYHVATKNSGTR